MAVADEAATDSDQAVLDDVPNAERLVAQAVEQAGDDHTTASLVSRFWRFAPDEELVGYTPEEMYSAAVEHRELARNRLPGELKLAITEPGGPQGHSVLRIVTDDMPFLVDSVIALLTAHNLQVDLMVHPLIVVRREPLGALAQLEADVEPDDAIEGDLVESWIRIEIDPIRRPEAREQLLNEVRRVLTDVRDAVEDWPRMRQRARLDRASQVARSRSLHLPRLPGVPAGRRRPDRRPRHRSGHPARRQQAAAARRRDGSGDLRAGHGETAPGDHQGELAGDRAPVGLPRLHRRQGVRRRRQRGR
jgi:glutamate dehydrogenase